MIDSFHLEAYGESTVNYNRDIELFPVLKKIIEKITGEESMFQSPTDMGVNRVGFGIVDDDAVREASIQEIIRRYYKTICDYKKGNLDKEAVDRMKMIMEGLGLKGEDREAVNVARAYVESHCPNNDNSACQGLGMVLEDGRKVTGKFSDTMNGAAAAILNAVKILADINDDIHLISPLVLEPIINLKKNVLNSRNVSLNAEEVLMALSISAVTNPVAKYAVDKLDLLKGCQAHSTVILSNSDEQVFRKLGVDVTCDPIYQSTNLYEG